MSAPEGIVVTVTRGELKATVRRLLAELGMTEREAMEASWDYTLNAENLARVSELESSLWLLRGRSWPHCRRCAETERP